MNIVLKAFSYFLRFLQVGISLFYKKEKSHIIIGSSAGTNINGNSKALFLYMKLENTTLKGYFITRKYSIYLIQKKLYPDHILYALSFKALYYCITAKAFVITHGAYDIAPFKVINMGKPLINLWHGTALKKIGLDSHVLSETQKKKILGNFDGLLVMSEEERAIMSRCYHTTLENVWVTGYPRNDFLFENNPDILKILPYIGGKKVLLYAPTFRDFRRTELFPFEGFEQSQLEEFLEKQNAILLMRVHKNELKYHNIQESDHIRISDGDTVQEINELLPYMDILITDYSSVYIDQLLIDKPMIFLPYDLDQFKIDRGFNFEFNEVTPGPKVSTFKDFMSQIEGYLSDPTKDSKWRVQVRDRFHKYHDNKSSKRVYERIEQLLS